MLIEQIINREITIESPDSVIYSEIKKNWDNVAKPLDSLGRFEDTISTIGAIQGKSTPDITKKAIVIMIADNGIVDEGVSQCGQEVTLAVAKSMGKSQSSVGKMGKVAKVDMVPIDIGINSDEQIDGVYNKKIAYGTKNFLKEPAMNKDQCLKALQTGIDAVKRCKEEGYGLIGMGEMGIGNTTTSSAITALLLDKDAAFVTGRGAGLSDEGLSRKINVIDEAINKYKEISNNPFEVLCAVGGLDIAGLAGVVIGGALYGVPIVMDGVISLVASLVATRLVPKVKEYLIASHISKEPCAQIVFNELGVNAVIDAKMALGEGTGAVMMMSLIDIAMSLYENKTTFEDMEIDAYSRM